MSTSELVADDQLESAHELANLAPWLGAMAALALIGTLFVHRHVTGRVAVGAAVLSVLFPPWIIPGAGVVVVTVARCWAHRRQVAPTGFPM